MKDKYYLRALRFLEAQAYEEALTAFLRGVDHHSPKCAFGVFRTVTLHGSFTLCAEEARAIFSASHEALCRIADEGDVEAMDMLAESILLGYDDIDEPLGYWLHRASELGSTYADKLIAEQDAELDAPLLAPARAAEDEEETALTVREKSTSLSVGGSLLLEDRLLIDSADMEVFMEFEADVMERGLLKDYDTLGRVDAWKALMKRSGTEPDDATDD